MTSPISPIDRMLNGFHLRVLSRQKQVDDWRKHVAENPVAAILAADELFVGVATTQVFLKLTAWTEEIRLADKDISFSNMKQRLLDQLTHLLVTEAQSSARAMSSLAHVRLYDKYTVDAMAMAMIWLNSLKED